MQQIHHTIIRNIFPVIACKYKSLIESDEDYGFLKAMADLDCVINILANNQLEAGELYTHIAWVYHTNTRNIIKRSYPDAYANIFQR